MENVLEKVKELSKIFPSKKRRTFFIKQIISQSDNIEFWDEVLVVSNYDKRGLFIGTGKSRIKETRNINIIYNEVINYINKGLTTQKAIKKANTNGSYFRRNISDAQKLELKKIKMSMAKGYK